MQTFLFVLTLFAVTGILFVIVIPAFILPYDAFKARRRCKRLRAYHQERRTRHLRSL